MKNHMNVILVKRLFLIAVPWLNIRGSIQGKDHIIVELAKRLFDKVIA